MGCGQTPQCCRLKCMCLVTHCSVNNLFFGWLLIGAHIQKYILDLTVIVLFLRLSMWIWDHLIILLKAYVNTYICFLTTFKQCLTAQLIQVLLLFLIVHTTIVAPEIKCGLPGRLHWSNTMLGTSGLYWGENIFFNVFPLVS